MSQPEPATAVPAFRPRRGVKIFLGLICATLIVIGALMAIQPEQFRIERSTVVDAPAEVVYSIINDLHQWERWSPYDKRDPKMKKSFDGPETGPGSSYSWNGNDEVGEGRLTIAESKPNDAIHMKLRFTRPFQCENDVTFTISPVDQGTKVSWIMDGKNNLFSRFFGIFMSMDQMVGKDFEEGLASLGKIAHADAEKPKSESSDATAPN